MGVRFGDETYLDPKMIANKFAHQFTPPPIRLTGDKSKVSSNGNSISCLLITLLTTYRAIDRTILSYCCLVWTPSHMDTNWSRLQRAQNSALRITTSCLKMADVAELHQESRELPACQHNELIFEQFAIACHLPQHPCHQLCHRPPDDRPERRRSLIGRFKPNIQQYLAEEPFSNTSYKLAISNIHQYAVRTAIESSSP